METGEGVWTLVKELNTFKSIVGRNFPVVLSFMNKKRQSAVSKLSPDEVVHLLAPALISDK